MEKMKKHFRILLGIYVVILIWGIILKMNWLDSIEFNFNRMVKLDFYSRFTYNFRPSWIKGDGLSDVFLNFLSFVPYGFLVTHVALKPSFTKGIGFSFLLSFLFETSQILTAIGEFAPSDLVFNTLGGAVGFVVFAIFDWIRKQFRREAQMKMTMAIVVICYACFVPLAVYGVAKTIYHIDFYLSLIEPMVNSLR